MYINNYPRSIRCCLPQEVLHSTPVCLQLQSPVLPPTSNHRSHSPIHADKYHNTDLLPPSRAIVESDIPICHREAATTEPRDTLGELDTYSAILAPDLPEVRRPEPVTLVLNSYVSSWNTKALRRSSLWMRICTIWTSKECVSLKIVVSNLHLLPINRASFKLLLLFQKRFSGSLLRRCLCTLVICHTNSHFPPDSH